jgi:hypothetical protein
LFQGRFPEKLSRKVISQKRHCLNIFCHILHKYESLIISKNWEVLSIGFQNGGGFQNFQKIKKNQDGGWNEKNR